MKNLSTTIVLCFLCLVLTGLAACEQKTEQTEQTKTSSETNTNDDAEAAAKMLAALPPAIQKRVVLVQTLFEKDKIVDNFLNLDKYLTSRPIAKAKQAQELVHKDVGFSLPETFESRDSTFNTKAFFGYTQSTGTLVAHKGQVIFEEYERGMTDSTTHISWSINKSFISALLGIAMEEGLIKSEMDRITNYLPQFKGTGYEGTTLKDCLEMSSGVRFVEDYGDPNSDIGRFGRHFALNQPLETFLMTIKGDKKPGTFNHYVSTDTQILGMVLKSVIGTKTLSDYLEEKIWQPLGMAHEAQWFIDESGMEFAVGGMNVTLRDYAKLGLLYLNKGKWNGKQIVPEAWVKKSINPRASHLMPGRNNPNSSNDFGYGYQWWIPIEPMGGDYFAAGIYNQYIYVNPEKDLVIVKTAANPHFTEDYDHSKENYIDLFQNIAKQF